MKKTLSRIALAAASLTLALANPAHAVMIAGWDFSQYFAPGLLTTDGLTAADVLPANYSNLDPTFGAGAESANYGRLFINGQHGSTLVIPDFSGTEAVVPADGSLVSNLDAPGAIPFDSHTVLADEAQPFQNFLSMAAQSAVNMVFAADLSGVPGSGSNWLLSFGARSLGATGTIGVEFSTDGVNYSPFGNVIIDGTDKLYSVNLFTGLAEIAYVRISAGADGISYIDNVAINATVVPEPGAAALCGLGALIAAGSALRRRAARA